jgi:hypothetical protein
MKIFRNLILTITVSGLMFVFSCTTSTQPVEVASVQGPLEPINPGGPVVAITLENISTKTITSLTAILKLNRDFTFEFDISLSKPLAPGEDISSRLTLIGGGFDSDVSYPLQVKGTFDDNSKFDFTKQVHITEVTPNPLRNLTEEEKVKTLEIILNTPEAQAQLEPVVIQFE